MIVSVLLLVAAAWVLAVAWNNAAVLGRVGADLVLYVEATRGWLAGDPFYPARQLAGPYVITDGDILYPPTTIPLFVAFVILPAALFWTPLAVVAWVVWRHGPAAWAWPLIALCLAFPPTMVKIVHGNPFMWTAGAVALGTLYRWPAVFALIKPSLAPFALIGVRDRRWWLGLAGFVLVALAFAPMWADYRTVLVNSANPGGLLYSAQDVPLLLVPLLARVSRGRSPTRSR